MLEKKETGRNPLVILADLLVTAQIEQLYIEQQDIYPMESQRAARILPALEEDIERRKSELTATELEVVEELAQLRNRQSNGDEAGTPSFDASGTVGRQGTLIELGKIAKKQSINEGDK